MKLEKGRPADLTGRLPKEVKTYDLLDRLHIEYERIDHEAIATMEGCAEVDKLLYPATICKNLFLCNRKKSKFYLFMIRGDKKFNSPDISKQIGSPRLSFAPEEYMEKYLDITPGSASVMGLMNDVEHQVQLLVDEDVLNSEYVGCHPCINTTSMRILSKDLFGTFLEEIGHNYIVVKAE